MFLSTQNFYSTSCNKVSVKDNLHPQRVTQIQPQGLFSWPEVKHNQSIGEGAHFVDFTSNM